MRTNRSFLGILDKRGQKKGQKEHKVALIRGGGSLAFSNTGFQGHSGF